MIYSQVESAGRPTANSALVPKMKQGIYDESRSRMSIGLLEGKESDTTLQYFLAMTFPKIKQGIGNQVFVQFWYPW